MAKVTAKGLWQALKEAFKGFSADKVMKLSGSLAYYTVFSLGPLLIVLIYIAGMFLGQEAAQGAIYDQVQRFIGHDGALQLQEIIKNAAIDDKGGVALVIGIVVLLIGATTVFGEIQDSINSIWGLKASPKAGLIKLVLTRLLSFGMIASLGFLLLVSMGATALVESLGKQLQSIFPDVAVVIFYIINLLLTLFVTTILFAIIFKFLPDAKIKWRDVWIGAIATSVFFLIGKFAISIYISKSEIGSTYGAAGSLVVILVWIYYSAMILYLGAEFTKAYIVKFGGRIQPNEYAVWEDRATVAGAKSEGTIVDDKIKEDSREKEKVTYRPEKKISIPRYVPSKKSASEIKEQKENPGIGVLLGGLAIYFFNTSYKKK
ncbi:MAG TPA: YihY/virulence factor BrkB family protein [Chitinophagaceae bacterium]